MLLCSIQYIVCFVNIAIVSAFCAKSLCCRSAQNTFGTKIKVLILLPFCTTLCTAALALHHLIMLDHHADQCIYFGSWMAMFSIDLENQIIFIDCVFFIGTMEVVLKKIMASNRFHLSGGTQEELLKVKEDILRTKRHMIWFVIAFSVSEAVILSLKGIIYLSDRSWWKKEKVSWV